MSLGLIKYITKKEVIECNEDGLPEREKRSKKRFLESDERIVEKNYMDAVKQFDFRLSRSWIWCKLIFDVKIPSCTQIRSVATFFSHICGITFPREAYRRKSSMLFWLENNIQIITKRCQELEAKIQIGEKIKPIPLIITVFPDVLIIEKHPDKKVNQDDCKEKEIFISPSDQVFEKNELLNDIKLEEDFDLPLLSDDEIGLVGKNRDYKYSHVLY